MGKKILRPAWQQCPERLAANALQAVNKASLLAREGQVDPGGKKFKLTPNSWRSHRRATRCLPMIAGARRTPATRPPWAFGAFPRHDFLSRAGIAVEAAEVGRPSRGGDHGRRSPSEHGCIRGRRSAGSCKETTRSTNLRCKQISAAPLPSGCQWPSSFLWLSSTIGG